MGNTLVGKYILEDWECRGVKSRQLRWINREGKKYYFSDVARTCVDYDKGIYGFYKKWSTKFTKDTTQPDGFRRSISHLSNTDGVMKYSVLQTPAECKCEHTFDEVFGNDLRDVQDKEDSPLSDKINLHEVLSENEKWVEPKDFWKVNFRALMVDGVIQVSKNKSPLLGDYYDEQTIFVKRLAKLFGVKNVNRFSTLSGCVNENTQTILGRTGTLFHFNQYKSEDKTISRNEDGQNLTMVFWLFDDNLIYQHESGKRTW